MKKLNEKLSIKIIIFNLLLILTIFVLSVSLGGCATAPKYDRIANISFSHDSKKLLFDRYRDDRPAMIHVYDLETEKLSAYQPPQGEGWYEARYSFDGKQIAFSITPQSLESNKLKQDLANTQIAIMDPSGKNVKKITDSSGWKIYPSFSHDNKKVIFAKAGKLGKRVPAIFYDVYEIDLESGLETRLTWFKFTLMSAPYYLLDDERIIFSAYGAPNMYPDLAENDHEAILKRKNELETSVTRSRIIHDNIYICKKGQKELPEPLNQYVHSPQVAANGIMLFNESSIIRQYSPGSNHRQIIMAFGMKSYTLSPDGTLLALVVGVTDTEREKQKIVIVNTNNGKISKDIILPDTPAPIINR